MELLEKLKFWLDPPSHLSTEPAYFHEKVSPLIPEIVKTITNQATEIENLRLEIRGKKQEIENLNARLDRHVSELSHLQARLAAQQPEINRLKEVVFKAVQVLKNGTDD